jgi:high-affinity iron transporter
MAPNDVFSVPVFLVVFRETLETVIIVSILLAFLKQTLGGPAHDLAAYKKLRRQVLTRLTLSHLRRLPILGPIATSC